MFLRGTGAPGPLIFYEDGDEDGKEHLSMTDPPRRRSLGDEKLKGLRGRKERVTGNSTG